MLRWLFIILYILLNALLYALFFTSTNSKPVISPAITVITLTPTAAPTIIPTVTVGLVGDLGLGRHITTTARSKKDFNWSFVNISPWLAENDFTLANLESPIITDCPFGPTGTFTFCGDTQFVPYLKNYKFVFNLNNNHILNYGQSGLSQTKDLLITDYFYDNFYTKTVNGITFGFLGYDFVSYPKLDTNEIISQIKKFGPQVDHLIVSIHWGNEYLLQPEKWRTDLAHRLIDAGADIIHGHHPHVWQNYEIYQGKYIFYSFGNFIFDQSWSYNTSHSQIARLSFSKNEIYDLLLYPIEIKFNSQPVLMP